MGFVNTLLYILNTVTKMTKTKQYKYLKSALNKLKKMIVIAKKKGFGYGDGDWHE